MGSSEGSYGEMITAYNNMDIEVKRRKAKALSANTIRSYHTTMGGGQGNLIDWNSDHSFLGGGDTNSIHSRLAVIGGGEGNSTWASGSTITGGEQHYLASGATGAAIGGGKSNFSSAEYTAMPGGIGLTSGSYAQTVLGRYNTSKGASTAGTINPTDPLLLVGNGTSTSARSNAFYVTNNGYSVVTNVNGPFTADVAGGTYRDNTVNAWGTVAGTGYVIMGTSTSQMHGVQSVLRTAVGTYRIILNTVDASGTLVGYDGAAITATIVNTNPNIGECLLISVSQIQGATFYVTIKNTSCQPADQDFSFHVVGRPL